MQESFRGQLKVLYESLYETMVQVAYRMTGSVETAQDLVQETFLLALFQEEKLSRHPMPEGWLIVTLKNLARNERRRWLRHPEVSLEAQAGLAGYSPEAPLDSLLPCQLPADDRRILIWRLEEQLEYREIADRLGISESACRSRLSRAAARCRQYLEGPGGSDGAKK